MSIAGYHPDPIVEAEDHLARSRQTLSSVSDDLKEHERWLASFAAQEKKSRRRHASRLFRQRQEYRLYLAIWRTRRFFRRCGLSVALAARAVLRFAAMTVRVTVQVAVATVRVIAGALARGAAFLRAAVLAAAAATGAAGKRVALATRNAAFAVARAVASLSSRLAARALALARATAVTSAAIARWSGAKAKATAIIVRNHATSGAAWAKARGHEAALAGSRAAGTGAAATARAARWSAGQAKLASSVTLAAAASSATWAQAKARSGAEVGGAKAKAASIMLGNHAASGAAWAKARGHEAALAGSRAAGTGAAATARAARWSAGQAKVAASVTYGAAASGATWAKAKAKSGAEAGMAASATGATATRVRARAASVRLAAFLAACRVRAISVGSAFGHRAQIGYAQARIRLGTASVDLQNRLHRGRRLAVLQLRRGSRGVKARTQAAFAATRPYLQGGRRRAALLGPALATRAHGIKDHASQAAMSASRWLALVAAGARARALNLRNRAARKQEGTAAAETSSPSLEERGAEAPSTPAAHRAFEPRRETALTCVEPWRCKLPAIPQRQTGRALLALH
jgi:hypothetical protein